MTDIDQTHDIVKEYYGKEIQQTDDLNTDACCTSEKPSQLHQSILANIDPELLTRFYGCGSPIPPALKKQTVLELGCGSGRDVYLASYLTGPEGYVIGVDITDQQLEIANRHKDSQMERFGFSPANVDFRKAAIEDLTEAGIADNSVDIVMFICVINLAAHKKKVFSEIFRVLKPGGELYFSNVFTNRRIPAKLQKDTVLYGECLSGALYIEDFRRILRDVGCHDFRIVSKSPVPIKDPEIAEKVGMIDFYSFTIRAFKLDTLEDICEDYGQVAYYRGNLPGSPHRFVLDHHHVFETGRPVLVCGNTAAMLHDTRFAQFFHVEGNRSDHYGPFDCAPGGFDPCGGECC